MNGSRITAKLFVAALAVLCVSSGCAHSAAIPQYSQRAPDRISLHAMTALGPAKSGGLLTWMSVPPHNSWDGNPEVGTMLDFGVVDQSANAGPQSQRLVQIGVNAIEYTNPNRQAASGDPNPEYTDDEQTFSHAADIAVRGNCVPEKHERLYRLNQATRYFQMQPDSLHLAQLWALEVFNFTAPIRPPKWQWAFGGQRTYVFEDVADNVDSLNGMPCGFANDDHWTALSIQLLSNAGADYLVQFGQDMPGVIYNGLDPRMSSSIRPAIGMNASPNVVGGVAENCYVRASGSSTIPVVDKSADHAPWSALENTEISMAQAGKLFICLGQAPVGRDASRLTRERLYQVASFLLTVDLNTSVFGEAYPTKSDFQVFPESQIVPANPVVPQPASISGLVIASSGGSDLYGREYGSCPVDGVVFPKCYIVVNPSASAIPFHWPAKYVSTIKIWGSDILDTPAWISTSGPRPAAVVGAGTAVIALSRR
ncbi:MAG TPA: hypothetical protein VII69_13390 [Candidatus Eremiobacteraceae bacterium]